MPEARASKKKDNCIVFKVGRGLREKENKKRIKRRNSEQPNGKGKICLFDKIKKK